LRRNLGLPRNFRSPQLRDFSPQYPTFSVVRRDSSLSALLGFRRSVQPPNAQDVILLALGEA
jgi:hypothetical protein